MTDQSPLYQQVKRSLLNAIARQEYEAGEPFITQRELCERFGVSTTTAIKALNELVAEGVLVRQRGRGTFVVERRRQAPADPGPRAAKTIALVVPWLEGPHITRVVHGAEAVCAQLGYRMFLSNSGGSIERETAALRQAADDGVRGILLYPVDGGADPIILGELRRAGMPLVMVDRYHPDVPTDAVIADNFAIGHALTSELISRGHRRIAMMWSDVRATSVQDRLAGHLRALSEHQIPVLPELTALRPYGDLPEPGRRALLTALLNSAQPPTALLCAHGYVLATAAHDLLALGVAVPEQVDLAGMDDAGPYDLLPLAAVAAVLPSEEMGRQAMQLLAERIDAADGWRDARHIQLPIEIRTRDAAAAHLRAVRAGTS